MSTPYTTLILSESGLIDYWQMGEASGTTTTDSKGAHNATVAGSSPPTLAQTGIPAGGTSYLFNGGGSTGVSYTQTAAGWNTGGTALSMEAWVFTASTLTTDAWICGFVDGGFHVLDIDLNSMAPIGLSWDIGSSGPIQTTAPNITTGTWHYLALTVVNSGALNLYVDSVVQSPAAMTGAVWATTQGSGASTFAIGGDSGSGSKDATFKICNIALYDVALTPTQILHHWDVGMGIGTGSLFLPATLSLGAGGPFFQSGVNS